MLSWKGNYNYLYQEVTTAIHSMAGMPAEKFNIQKRGTIMDGHFADITMMDLNCITDRVTYSNPHQYAKGIVYLLVNGKLAIDNKESAWFCPGNPLHRA